MASASYASAPEASRKYQVQVVDYREIQFSKVPAVWRGLGIGELEQTPAATHELHLKGLADD